MLFLIIAPYQREILHRTGLTLIGRYVSDLVENLSMKYEGVEPDGENTRMQL